MEYRVNTLEKFASDKAVIFDPPKKMIVWDFADIVGDGNIYTVYAYIPDAKYPVKTSFNNFKNCAEIPEESKPRRATNRELAKWLAQGNGEYSTKTGSGIWMQSVYDKDTCHNVCPEHIVIRKWDDTEWHEPTADYMGLEG